MADPIPEVRDLRPKIRALFPQNAQARVLAGVALLMILVIAFSGRKSGPPVKAAPTTSGQASDPNLQRIREYEAGIEAATRQLSAQEAELAQAKQALSQANPSASMAAMVPAATVASPPSSSLFMGQDAPAPASDARKREEQSLFASNIALSYRAAPTPVTPAATVQPPSSKEDAHEESLEPKTESTYRLVEGTVIETVLTNRLDSSFSGPVNCMVTTNVYSADRTALLIPQGSRVLGETRKVESAGEQRLAVFFHRLIRPDGYSISLDRFQALSQVGETGLLDQVNHHYMQIFGAAIAVGAIAGLAQANTRYSGDESAGEAYQQGVASSLSQSSMHVLDRYLNVLPTFTIREGQRVKVYLAQDLSLPAYPPGASLSKE